MDKALLDRMNTVYGPLARRARELTRRLGEAGLTAHWGWYAFHSVRVDGTYETEEFPIPVVSVEGLGDVGFDLDSVFLELQIPRKTALAFDYGRLPEGAEVYGAEDYLGDFYRPGMGTAEVVRRIEESREQTVCIAVSFPGDAAVGTLYREVGEWYGRLNRRPAGTTGIEETPCRNG